MCIIDDTSKMFKVETLAISFIIDCEFFFYLKCLEYNV